MVLFAVFNVLLHKYTSQEYITVGTPVTDRPHVDLHQMIGMFVNMMPVRSFPSPSKTFETFLKEIKETSLEVYKNQDCQFDVLVEKLGLKGNIESNPLFNVAFALQNIDLKPVIIDGAIVRPYQIRHKVSHFDMVFEVLENKNEIDIIIEFSTTLFKKASIQRFGKSFKTILEEITSNPDIEIGNIKALTQNELKQILFDFNDTSKEYSQNKLIHQLFEEQVTKQPDAIAVEYKNQQVPYRELNEHSNSLAAILREQVTEAGKLIAIVIDRSIEIIIGVMSILKAGGAYVPLEPYLPDERIRKILEDLNIETVITGKSQLEKVSRITREIKYIKNIICIDIYNTFPNMLTGTGEDDKVFHYNGKGLSEMNNLVPLQTSDDTAYVIFTSGSTGTPKGVVVRHKPVINLIEWVNNTFNVNHQDKLLFITSISFDLSVYDIFGILCAGGTIHLKLLDEIREPGELANSIIEHGITFWDSAPPALQQLNSYFAQLENKGKSKLRLVFLSGDWIPVTLPNVVRETFKNVKVIGLGGATEAAIWSNYYPIGLVEAHWVSIPYGKPIQNAKYYILDKSLKPCPIGVAGDLYIGGQCLATGYINDPELTASKFIENPFVAGEKIYKTGDLARWFEDGNMEFLGRADYQVKIRGFRIELGEIESSMLKHELIKEAVVLAKGEKRGDKHLVAYFVADEQFTVQDLKSFLLKELPEYMVPSYFIQIEEMPLTPNGKLDRKALETMEAEVINTGVEYLAPTTELEMKIREMFNEEIGIEIGLNDNFFDVGFSSITIIKVLNKVNNLFNTDITVIKMFQYPTIKTFVQYLNEVLNEGNINEGRVGEHSLEDSFSVFEKTLSLLQNE